MTQLFTRSGTEYTGEVIERLEDFSTQTGKPSIHFFGHTHAYERGQSKDHNHLWVNVAAGEGGIDFWDQSDVDYPEFQRVFPDWGFVIMEVEAGDNPRFRLRRVSRGNVSDGSALQHDAARSRVSDIAQADDSPRCPVDARSRPCVRVQRRLAHHCAIRTMRLCERRMGRYAAVVCRAFVDRQHKAAELREPVLHRAGVARHLAWFGDVGYGH